jgi:DNA polymerase-3 subunit epsilon
MGATVSVGVVHELDPSKPWRELPIAMIDTETTGRDPAEDRIVEIAIVKGCAGGVLTRNTWLIDPKRSIPEGASQVHGIYDKDVAGQPTFADVCDEVLACMADAIPAAFNAGFDRGFLLAEIRRLQRSDRADVPATRDHVVWMDPLVWARHLFPNERNRKLGTMASLLGVALENAHRATADAEAALMVMYKMAEGNKIPEAYGKMVREQVELTRQQEDARTMWRRR